jgi:hypothetical protein
MMIQEKDVAIEINNLILDVYEKLNESVRFVQERCGESGVIEYRKAVAMVMGSIVLDVMNPLYLKYPDLKPKAFI